MKILAAWLPNFRYDECFEEVQYLNALQTNNEAKVFPLVMPSHQEPVSVDSQLMEVVDAYKPDVFISWIYKGTLRKETFEYLKNSNITTVGIFGDDEKYFYDYSMTPSKEFTKVFNWSVTSYRPAIGWHINAGADNIHYMPYSANHKTFKDFGLKKDVAVSFCGSRKHNRIDTLNKLYQAGININVYGVGWDTRELLTPQYVNLINRTKVNINLSIDIVGGREIVQVKGRDFEVPMAGGFLLTHSGAIEEFYVPGKEIETYSTIDEMADKIRFYLMKESKREKIAEAGHKRALKDHKSHNRIKELLKVIGGKCG